MVALVPVISPQTSSRLQLTKVKNINKNDIIYASISLPQILIKYCHTTKHDILLS